MSQMNDDQVLALSAKIKQLRSAEADVKKAEDDLDARKKTRDDLKRAVEKLRGAAPSPTSQK